MLTLAVVISLFLPMAGQASDNERMEWFAGARLGIFIHWGLYSVNGVDESWSFYNGYIPYEEYMKQTEGFRAESYDPDSWVRLIKESGAGYAVITSRHHDGFALWDTKLSRLNAVDTTPAGRDLIKPFVRSLKRAGIKTGIYYSLPDWSHPDYPGFTRKEKRYENDSLRWSRYLSYCHGQIDELCHMFDPDLFWFDGDWEQSAAAWQAEKIRKNILDHDPDIIINSRLAGYGDYATPEQGLPLSKPEEKYWELCMTINDSWGYQWNDNNYKTPNQVIRIFSECISKGGNLLLDIGPRADGTIPEEQVTVLRELGRWTAKHREAIYGTKAGVPAEWYNGPTTISSDSTRLYLFLPGDGGGEVMLEGLTNKIGKVYVVGNGTNLEFREYLRPYWSNHPGVWFIKVPEAVVDRYMTVIGIVLEGSIKLEKQ